MAKSVCLDTQIMIWGIKQQAIVGQEQMIPWAKAFIGYLARKGIAVIIPAPVVTEFLTPISPDSYPSIIQELMRGFRVVPFDLKASVSTAALLHQYRQELWGKESQNTPLREYKDAHNIPKTVVKFDFQIVGTAIAQKCDCIYSHDPHLKKFAGNAIPVLEMPSMSELGR